MSVTQETYRRIIATAGNVLKLTAPHAPRTSSPNATSPAHVPDCSLHMRLPLPSPIVRFLIDDGIHRETAEKLSESFMRISEILREKMESTIRSTWLKVSEVPRHDSMLPLAELRAQLWKTHENIYNRKVKDWAEQIRRQAKARIVANGVPEKVGNSRPVANESKKPTFNQNFLPTLESLFAKNQKPTRNDKLLLAEKSGMTYKQIHVWFQNRRNRTKKAIQDEAPSSGPEIDISSQVDAQPSSLLRLDNANVGEMASELSSRSSSVTLVDENHSFDWNAPAYAFPATYPPTISVEEDPFPCSLGDLSMFSKLSWPRKPTTSIAHQYEEDLEGLTNAFERLRIGDESRSKSPSKSLSCDITSPYTVRPLRAPLISLIRNFTSCVVHRSGKLSYDAQPLRRKVNAKLIVETGAQCVPRKTRRRPALASRGSAFPSEQNSAPLLQLPSEPTSSSVHNLSSVPSSSASSADPPEVNKSTKNKSSSRRAPAVSTSKNRKDRSAPVVQTAEPSSEPPTVHPSPTASIDSLPSLSYSSGSSSASSYSHSPTMPFATLSDDGYLPSLDGYQSNNSSLTLPPAQCHFDDFPPPMFASSGETPFDFSKGPLDLTFNLDLPTYPSYSESFDSISRGLQSSPDFAPPALTFDLPPFAI